MDEVLLNIWGQYIIDSNSGITSNDMLLQPAGALFVDGNPAEKVALLPRKAVLQESYVEEEAIKTSIEDAAAATPLQQGVADTSRQTATEIQTLRAQGDQRFVLQTMWLDYTLKKELLTRGFKFYQKQLPPGRLVKIVGTDYSVPIDISSIQDPVDIVVESGMAAFGREARIQSMAELVQLAASEVFAPWLKPGEIDRKSVV